jgi:hypothetical protein
MAVFWWSRLGDPRVRLGRPLKLLYLLLRKCFTKVKYLPRANRGGTAAIST